MLNVLKKLASAVIATVIAFTVIGAFSRLNTYQVNADVAAASTSELQLSGKARMKYYGNKKGTVNDGVLTIGKRNKKKNVYAVTINLKNNTKYTGGIRYMVYRKSKGWTGWKASGYKAGSGKKYRIEGIRIELTGELAKHYSVMYSAYMQSFKDKQGWVCDGAAAGTPGEKKRLEEIKIKIVPRDKLEEQPTLSYRMYRDKYKWGSKWFRDGETAGVTSGSYQKHEGLQMAVTGSRYTGNIEYRVRGAGYSWTAWTTKNSKAGKYNKGKRMEEIQIRLTGELAEHFDIYYRTYVKNKGWLGWARNGTRSGSEKYDYYIMALQSVIVPKGSKDPGNLNGVKSKYTSSYLVNGNPKMPFADFKTEYKKSNTMLGIDVSKYQGNIDFKKVKKAGCEFVILRCYVRNNYYDKSKKKYVWCNAPDQKFEQNYKNAKAAGLKIGVYFFTCDYTEDNMRKYTRDMIKKCLKGKELDFPVAFDWENYDYYKRAHKDQKWSTSTLNKHAKSDLNKMLAVFEEEVENAGFAASIYGSKSKMETTWSPSLKKAKEGKNHLSTWLAHWVTKSSYKGDYYMWQVNSHGRIPGISGEVDLDLAYINRLPSPKAPPKPEEPEKPEEPDKPDEPDKDDGGSEEQAIKPADNAKTGKNMPEPEKDETEPEEGNATPDEGSTAPAEDGKEPVKDNEEKGEESPEKETEPEKKPAPEKEKEPEKEPEKEKEAVGEKEPVKEASDKPAAPAITTKAPERSGEPEKDAGQDKDKTPAKASPAKEQPDEAKTEEPK